MNIQELEHWQHVEGSRTELENLFAQSKGEVPVIRVNRNYVNWLSSLGFFVVLSHWEVFCPYTDAFLGRASDILCITRSTGEAFYWANESEFSEIIYPEPQK